MGLKEQCRELNIQVWMAAGRPPSSFPQNGLQIEFRDALDVSAELGDVLEGLLVRSLAHWPGDCLCAFDLCRG